jgi:hypothetical protein
MVNVPSTGVTFIHRIHNSARKRRLSAAKNSRDENGTATTTAQRHGNGSKNKLTVPVCWSEGGIQRQRRTARKTI